MDLNDIFTLSHELRTPVAIISSAASVLSLHQKNGRLDDEKCAKIISTIIHNCNSLTKIVNNILDSAEESGSYSFSPKYVNLYDFIDEICRNSYDFIKDMEIDLRCSNRELYIECDVFAIQRVLLNLISNSCKYNVNKPKIIISIKDMGSFAAIKICDNGIGIPKSMYTQVFEPFFCFSGKMNNIGGCGLGLNIVKNIVKMHNGEISLHSREGVGSIFCIKLPKMQEKSCSKMNQSMNDFSYSDLNLYKVELSDFLIL